MARLLWPALLILAECMNKNILLSRAIISEPDPGPEIGLKEVVLRCVEAAPGTSLPSSGEEGGCQEMC